MSYDKWWEDTDEDFKRKLIDQELEDADLQDNPIATEGWGVFLAKGLAKVGISSLENKLSQKSADKIMSVFKEPRVAQWIDIQAKLILKQASPYAKKFMGPDIKMTFATLDDVKKYADNPLNGVIDYDGTSKLTTDLEYKKCFTFDIKCGKYMLEVNADSTSIKRVFLFLKSSDNSLCLATVKAPDDQELLKIVGAIESSEVATEGVSNGALAAGIIGGFWGATAIGYGIYKILNPKPTYYDKPSQISPIAKAKMDKIKELEEASKEFMKTQDVDSYERRKVVAEAISLVKKHYPKDLDKRYDFAQEFGEYGSDAEDFYKGNCNLLSIGHTPSKWQEFPGSYELDLDTPAYERAQKYWSTTIAKCEAAVNKGLSKKYKGKYKVFFEEVEKGGWWEYCWTGDGDEGLVIVVDVDMINKLKDYIKNKSSVKEAYNELVFEGFGMRLASKATAAGWGTAIISALASISTFGAILFADSTRKLAWGSLIGGAVVGNVAGSISHKLREKANKYIEASLSNPEMAAYIRAKAKEVVNDIKKQASSMKDGKYVINTNIQPDDLPSDIFHQSFKAPGEETDERIEKAKDPIAPFSGYEYTEKKVGEYTIAVFYDTNSIKGLYVVVEIKDLADKYGASWIRVRPIPAPSKEDLKKMNLK